MKFSTLFYVIYQGFRNTIKNKWFTLASVATIAACLFLFGIFYAVIVNFQNIVKTAEEGVSVTVFFDEGTPDERIAEIGDLIRNHTAVASANFISADEAWEDFKQDYLEGYADGFTENPLANSENYEIYLQDVSRQAELVSYLEAIDGVRRVNRSEVTANTLMGVNSLVAYVSIGMIAILLAVSIFLISNTVMIGISVRKDEIAIMKYIGATDFFVRSPFVIEGIIIGALGSLIPMGIIYFLYNEMIVYIMTHFSSLTKLLAFVPVEQVFHYLVPISLGVGMGIGFIGSYVTVRRHIKV
ncbi:MAG: permease-like cell division protein FtsX [Lachnospiraceae bacterium]|nr:permease-like cell division protein FtsX [Lachnospiraceae bacterium]